MEGNVLYTVEYFLAYLALQEKNVIYEIGEEIGECHLEYVGCSLLLLFDVECTDSRMQ